MESVFLQGTKKEVNLGSVERMVFAITGAGLIGVALGRRSNWSIPLGLVGGSLLFQGLRGRFFVYQMLGIDRSRQGREGISVEHAVTVNRPVGEVYQFWRDFSNLPRFMRHLETVEVIDAKRSRWVAKAPLGASVEWQAEITQESPNEMIGWRSLPDSQVENSGMVSFQTAPGNRGTEVQVSLVYQPVTGSTAAAAIAKLLGEEPDRQIREDLLRFKQVLETGEFATVEGQSSGRVNGEG
ncbi:MAG TPA: SRPBCC family protein [Anaerolineaceae bacterium]|nr:SRPBCC family protein [Anaerolineaceae bacterium]